MVGGGGASLAEFAPINTRWSIFKDHDFGFVKLTAFDQSNLLLEYKKSSDGQVYDSFRISREYRDILACTVDNCPPTTLASWSTKVKKKCWLNSCFYWLNKKLHLILMKWGNWSVWFKVKVWNLYSLRETTYCWSHACFNMKTPLLQWTGNYISHSWGMLNTQGRVLFIILIDMNFQTLKYIIVCVFFFYTCDIFTLNRSFSCVLFSQRILNNDLIKSSFKLFGSVSIKVLVSIENLCLIKYSKKIYFSFK